jgi:hypothetical protein
MLPVVCAGQLQLRLWLVALVSRVWQRLQLCWLTQHAAFSTAVAPDNYMCVRRVSM